MTPAAVSVMWPAVPSSSLLVPIFAAALLATSACGGNQAPERTHTGGREEPGSAAERRILEDLDRLPSGQAKTIGDTVLVAEPPYHSASGAVCRWIELTTSPGGSVELAGRAERRLACKEGASWFYAPAVLVAPESEP